MVAGDVGSGQASGRFGNGPCRSDYHVLAAANRQPHGFNLLTLPLMSPRPLHPLTTEIFTQDGIKIRRFESGRCVREDEWRRFVEVNEVRSSTHSGCGMFDIGVALTPIIHVKKRTVREASSAIQTR